jgi:transposase
VGLCAIKEVLFPGVEVELKQLTAEPPFVVLEAAACGRPPCCPDCGSQGRRVHSTYWRGLAELPLAGQKLSVRLRVRRFFCEHTRCERQTFVEQVEGLSERRRRSSLRLKRSLRSIAVELGGRAGERLCRKISLPAGRTRLLKLLEAPEVPDRAPRVLGVDEFAFRRGRRYGTILIDVEAGRVVDVLRDRTSETFAAWLIAHP